MLAEDFQKELSQAISMYYQANRNSGTMGLPDPPKIEVIRASASPSVIFDSIANLIRIT